jgi:calmodulin
MRREPLPSHLLSSLSSFQFFDKDGNGVISPDELSEIMKGLGANLSDKEINLLVKEADANGDGEIDVGEFLALMYS